MKLYKLMEKCRWAKIVSLRTVRVNGKEYLQVVEYKSIQGKEKVIILKSFGENTLMNRLQAIQFKASFQALKTFKTDANVQGAEDLQTVINLALVAFGAILGIKFITDYFSKPDEWKLGEMKIKG